MKRKIVLSAFAVIIAVLTVLYFASDVLQTTDFKNTAFSLVPPVTAIIFALITKEVYSSLFMGIVTGALLYSNFNPVTTLKNIFTQGVTSAVADAGNQGIIIFLVTLGIFVVLLSHSGGIAAFGKFASKHIHSRRAAMLTTFALGILLSVDDYFNTLTVGNIMRTITDRNKISRAKLAYIIDATAAPMCMIMPISSWAAAVSSNIETQNGIEIFLKAIPYNFYSLLTLAMVALLAVLKLDFGPMKTHEINALNGDLFTVKERLFEEESDDDSKKGCVADMLVPVILLIVASVSGMLYTGGFFDGKGLIEAFSDCDAPLGLCMGSLTALAFTIVYLYLRKLLSFKELMGGVAEGFKSMVSAILILVFAWSLSEMTLKLGAREFVTGFFAGKAASFSFLLPMLVFLISVALAFATGTSWGTMGILLPIVAGIGLDERMLIISISACLAGAVCGDHCSPISDTNIMSSTAAHCDHLAHVATQLPYAAVVLTISAVMYFLAGLTKSAFICLPVAFVILAVVLFAASKISKGKKIF